MSISYKLFNIPRTLDEFLDRLDKSGKDYVDVYFKESLSMNPFNLILTKPGLYEYRVEYGLRHNGCSIKLANKRIRMPIKYSPYAMAYARKFGLGYMEMALKYADMLKSWGYSTTINGHTPERVRQGMNFLELKLNDFVENSIVL